MALHTGQPRMFPGQWKAGQFVVEQYAFFPAVDIVAAAAIGTQLGGMRIIVRMATHTFGGR